MARWGLHDARTTHQWKGGLSSGARRLRVSYVVKLDSGEFRRLVVPGARQRREA